MGTSVCFRSGSMEPLMERYLVRFLFSASCEFASSITTKYRSKESKRRQSQDSSAGPSTQKLTEGLYLRKREERPVVCNFQSLLRHFHGVSHLLPFIMSLQDCSQKAACEWTPPDVSCLLEAYGEKHALGRAYLRINDWEDVVNRVNAQPEPQKDPKTIKQCRDKVDSLKKRYKIEKIKAMADGQTRSPWPFFDKLNDIMDPAKTDAVPIFEHQVIRIRTGSNIVKLKLSSSDPHPRNASCEKPAENVSDTSDEQSDEPPSPRRDLMSGTSSAERSDTDSSSEEDSDTDSGNDEHSETELSLRKEETVLKDDGSSEEGLESPELSRKNMPDCGLGSEQSLDNRNRGEKAEPLSNAHHCLGAKKKIEKKHHSSQALADAILAFSHVYARAELAKMELYTSMNLEIAKLRMKGKRGKGSVAQDKLTACLDYQFLLNL